MITYTPLRCALVFMLWWAIMPACGSRGQSGSRASCMFVLGNQVNGGTVHGNVPPLAIENLEDGRDVPVTTDFRSVFSEVVRKHLSIRNESELFPNWSGGTIGVMR